MSGGSDLTQRQTPRYRQALADITSQVMSINTARARTNGRGKGLSYAQTNEVAFEWFGRAAAQADKDSLWQLALMEYGDIGTPKNPASAIQLHQKAAELGQVDAMYHLGVAYTNGNGVQKDYPNALQWLSRSVTYEDAYGRNAVRPDGRMPSAC